MTSIDYEEVQSVLVDIAKRAGQKMLEASPAGHEADEKKNMVDLVTETDKAVEEMVNSILKEKYPGFKFLGEESYTPGQRLTEEPTFICDPIDGTTNFVHRYPGFCISLALAVNRKPVVGVIFHPMNNELYTAIVGKGSYLTNLYTNNKQRLPLSKPEPLTSLQSCLLAVEWGSERKGNNWEVKLKTFENLAGEKGAMVHSMRSLGSAALNICSVARGAVDIYWEGGCWAWDVAAGWVILEEAGGKMCDGNPAVWGEDPEVDGRRYLCVRGAPSGQKEVVEEFWGRIVGRYDYSV